MCRHWELSSSVSFLALPLWTDKAAPTADLMTCMLEWFKLLFYFGYVFRWRSNQPILFRRNRPNCGCFPTYASPLQRQEVEWGPGRCELSAPLDQAAKPWSSRVNPQCEWSLSGGKRFRILKPSVTINSSVSLLPWETLIRLNFKIIKNYFLSAKLTFVKVTKNTKYREFDVIFVTISSFNMNYNFSLSLTDIASQ